MVVNFSFVLGFPLELGGNAVEYIGSWRNTSNRFLRYTLAPPKPGQGTNLVSWVCHKCRAINAPTDVNCVNVVTQRIEQTSAGKKVTVEQQTRCHHRRCNDCVASYGPQKH